MHDKYVKSRQVDEAVAAIQRGEFSNYVNAANKYGCHASAVSRRIRGLTKSKKEANLFWHQCLTIEQEEVLIHRINTLTD
jgi:alkylated DNA nucleotide flippase Atl1